MTPLDRVRCEIGAEGHEGASAVPAGSEATRREDATVRSRLLRPHGVLQTIYDFIGAPLRMVVLPDAWSTRLGFTSLEDERLRVVLPELRGRVLDVGAGTNRLMDLHGDGVGVDVIDWGGGATVVEDTRNLPFPDASFETVAFVACLNHIPYRDEVLIEAKRLLRPGGRVVLTMIGRWLGDIGHKIWWYSEDKHREVADGELMGMDPELMLRLLCEAGFADLVHRPFFYRMNHLFLATKT